MLKRWNIAYFDKFFTNVVIQWTSCFNHRKNITSSIAAKNIIWRKFCEKNFARKEVEDSNWYQEKINVQNGE